MGYTSQVAIAIKKEEYHKRENQFKKVMHDCDELGKTTDAYFFTWDCVKWYPNYPEVQELEKLLREIDEEDYGFIRVGEEDNDIERKGCPNDYDLNISITLESFSSSPLDHKDFFAPNSIKFIKDED